MGNYQLKFIAAVAIYIALRQYTLKPEGEAIRVVETLAGKFL